jgi:hypothetical protein
MTLDRSEPATLEQPSNLTVSAAAPRGRTYRGLFGFLRRHWNGEYSLGRSYWVNTFLVSLFVLGLGLFLSGLVSDRPARFASAAVLFVTALGYAAWVWSVRGTWVSASKRTAAGGNWGLIAKIAIVLGFVRVLGTIGNDGSRLAEHWAILMGKQAGPQYTIHVSRTGKSITVNGGMNDGAADALTQALSLAPGVRIVIFDSGGGWVREGRLVAGVISAHGLDTYVAGRCSSACTLAFLAGKNRMIGPHGKLGFHQVRSVGGSDLARVLDINRTRSMYESAGLPGDFIERIVKTPPDKMWFPTVAELLAAHVITRKTEWDAARADLTREIQASLEGNVKTAHLPETAFKALLDCEVGAYIQWLNTTDCSYLHDKTTQSLEEHLKEQQACLTWANNGAKLAEIDLSCTKALPNEWSLYSDMFAQTFATRADRHHPTSPAAQQVGACAAAQYVTQLNQTGCRPMTLDASTKEALFATDCTDKLRPSLDQQMNAVLRDCRAAIRRNPPRSR